MPARPVRSVVAATVVILISCAVCLGADDKPAAQGPRKPAELKVFERMVGTFDTTMHVKKGEWTPEEVRNTGSLTREWVLGGRFLQEKAKNSDGVEAVVMFTYDPNQSVYRVWHFNTAGLMSETRGTWDEATSTLKFTAEDGTGMSTTGAIRIIDNDNHEWHATVRDKAGKVYWDGSGTAKRQAAVPK